MLASELYAYGCGTVCLGDEECHWCSAKCKRHWLHDDPPRPQYVKPVLPITSKRPGNSYICTGCWHYRCKSVTVRFLSGKVKDRQSPCNHSLFLTDDGSLGIDKTNADDCVRLYEMLMKPPLTFSLMIHAGIPNLLQYATVNEYKEVRANTKLQFTLGNVPYEYTVYDLENTLKHPTMGGNEPGVQALLREYGRPECFTEKEEKKLRGGQVKKMEESASHVSRVVSSRTLILKSA